MLHVTGNHRTTTGPSEPATLPGEDAVAAHSGPAKSTPARPEGLPRAPTAWLGKCLAARLAEPGRRAALWATKLLDTDTVTSGQTQANHLVGPVAVGAARRARAAGVHREFRSG